MARWIKTDGTERRVSPAKHEFTNVELHQYVPGSLTGLTLTRDEEGLFMFMDDESMSKDLPENRAATALLHQHRPDLAHITVYGDVVVASLQETGDE